MRTETHKLIYFWKKDQWECYDLVADPLEMHNIYNDPKAQKLVAQYNAYCPVPAAEGAERPRAMAGPSRPQ